MSESTELPVLDSRNSNSDSNSERETTPNPAPASPPSTEETLVESVVKIVGATNSNLSDETIHAHDNAVLHLKRELLCHSASDSDIYRGSRSKVEPPKDIMYSRSTSGLTDIIGNKVVTNDTKLHGVSDNDRKLYRYWMDKTPEFLERNLNLKIHSSEFTKEQSNNSLPIFAEGGVDSHELSGNSDPNELYENDEPLGVDLTQLMNGYYSQLNNGNFSILSNEEDEKEHSSD
ncbi:hypothetical protein K501DRAFT_335676 [Backusella circina FSU 941]|nr:hypothetical protein K501DRAFT_335676 [Backusella circina FSU 941]